MYSTEQVKEAYRIGKTVDGDVTLTLYAPNGCSITMTMAQNICKSLIKMLESTIDEPQRGLE